MSKSQRGIALPIVLFALVVIGAMITGVIVMARVEQRSGATALAGTQAMSAAETGLNQTIANWLPFTYNNMAVDSEVTGGSVSLGGNVTYSPTVRRVNGTTFLVRAEGKHQTLNGSIDTRRRLGQFVRLNIPSINMNAAVTVRGGITVTGSSQISGRDSVPAGWGATCPPPGGTVAGIRDSSGNVTTSGACSSASCITGNPRIQIDSTVNSATFTQFGNVSFSQLAASANKLFPGGANITGVGPTTTGTPAVCDASNILNWGDPLNPLGPCFNYFPIIYSSGDLHISGGYGQGILLVNGNLDVTGGFQFYGPAIVTGTVSSTGTGGHFFGGLMASSASLGNTFLAGNSVVDFSTCAVTRALSGSATVKAFAQRGWAQLF